MLGTWGGGGERESKIGKYMRKRKKNPKSTLLADNTQTKEISMKNIGVKVLSKQIINETKPRIYSVG